MQAENLKSQVLRLYQAFDEGAMDSAVDQLSSNFVAHLAGVAEPLDREGFKQFGLAFYNAFAEGQHCFDEVIVAEDRVITWGTFTAIHQGSFQGLPPTGKSIRLAVMHIDRVADGKIVEHWGQGDALGLMQQLGIVFLPGPALVPALLKSLRSRWVGSL